MKIEEREVARELILARQASLMIRQAALKQLVQQECSQYEEELNAQGKAFYIKRT